MADLATNRATSKAQIELTPKQSTFVDAYLGEANFNAGKAAKMAGYTGHPTNLSKIGRRLLGHPAIAPKIDEVLKQSKLSRDNILARYARMADAEVPTEVVKGRGGRTERYEAMQALDRIAKIQGLLGGDTTQVNVNLTVSLPREERVDRILDILFPPAPAIEEGEAMEADYTEEGGDDNVAGDW